MSLNEDPPIEETGNISKEPQEGTSNNLNEGDKSVSETHPTEATEIQGNEKRDTSPTPSASKSTSISGDENIIGNSNIKLGDITTDNPEVVDRVFDRLTEYQKIINKRKPYSRNEDASLRDFQSSIKENKKGVRGNTASKKHLREGIKGLESPKDWFNKLTENQKLYAMLVVLLKNLDREVLDIIYISAVDNLRKEGLSDWLNDARTLGLDDLLDALMATEENNTVQLLPEYEEEIKRQINNRYHLLWSIFERLLSNNEREIALTDRVIRESLGHAIGRIGLRYPNKLENLLDKFAAHPSNRIVVIAGYALAEIVGLDSGEPKFFSKVLDKWIASKQPDQSWAATASIWRIYLPHHKNEEVKNILWKNLEILINDIDDLDVKSKREVLLLIQNDETKQADRKLTNWFWEKVDVISDALNHMFDANPEDVVSHLTRWLKPGDQDKSSFVSQRAVWEILNRISRSEFQSLDSATWGVKLLLPILDINDEDLTQAAFSAMRAWLTSDVLDEANKQKIIKIIVEIIDCANSNQLEILRKGLVEYCLTSGADFKEFLPKTSLDLLARTYFVDGYPIIPKEIGSLILFSDASDQGKAFNSPGLTSRIHPALSSVVDTYVYLMGHSNIAGSPGKLFQDKDQLIWHDLPNLIPSNFLETLPDKSIDPMWIVTLRYGPIINEVDILAKFPNTRIVRLTMSKFKDDEPKDSEGKIVSIEHSTNEESNPLRWSISANDIFSFSIKNSLENSPNDLWGIAQNYVKCKPIVEQVIKQIQIMFNKIQEASLPSREEYFSISCLFLWLIKKDYKSAIQICIDWINDNKKNGKQTLAAGICFGKLILRASIYLKITPTEFNHLSAALLKARPDWSIFELVIQYIETYANNQTNLDDSLIFDPSDLISFLPSNLKAKMVMFLDDIKSNEKSGISIKKFCEKARFFIEAGLLSSMPDIGENQKFGLIFIDGDLSDREYLNYALSFISELEKYPLGKNVLPVLYRLGQRIPLTVGYEKNRSFLSGITSSLPNILNPLLTTYEKSKVQFRVFFIKNLLYDFDDQRTEWKDTPTVILDGNKRSKLLEHENLLFLSPYDYIGNNATTVPDEVGRGLTLMIKNRS